MAAPLPFNPCELASRGLSVFRRSIDEINRQELVTTDKNRRVSARQPTSFSLRRKEKEAKETLFIAVARVRNPFSRTLVR
jgi:hypothetical protein